MSFTAEVSTFMETLGPFYEPVHDDEENLITKRLRSAENTRNNPPDAQLNGIELADNEPSVDSSNANKETDNEEMLRINGNVNGNGNDVLVDQTQSHNIGEGCNNGTIKYSIMSH